MNIICSNCNQTAHFFCGRCRIETYCSKDCQKAAFSQHRYHCFTLPTLFPINSKQISLNGTNQKAPNSDASKVQQMQKMPISLTQDGKFKEILQHPKMVVKAEVHNEKELEPKKEEIKNSAEIIDPQLKLPKIRKPGEVMMPTTNAQPAPIDSKERAAERPMESIQKKRREDTVSNISSISYKFSLPKQPKAGPILFSDLNVRDLNPGIHSVIISHGDPAKKLFCVLENVEEMPKYMRAISKAVKKAASKEYPPFDPKCEEMILAKFEDVFYRACVIDKNENGYVVLFVDYGNIETVKGNEIKPFDHSLMMDIVVNEVEFRNLPVPMTKKAKAILTQEKIDINIKKERSANGGYIADIVGLL